MPVQSKKVYIAPDILTAFVDRANTKHDQAAAYFRYFSTEHYNLYTDILSVYEASTTIAMHISPSFAKDFLKTMLFSSITILYPEESETKSALKLVTSDPSGELTLQRTLMAVLADRKNIPQLCTFEYYRTLFGLSMFYIPI